MKIIIKQYLKKIIFVSIIICGLTTPKYNICNPEEDIGNSILMAGQFALGTIGIGYYCCYRCYRFGKLLSLLSFWQVLFWQDVG